MKKSIVPIAFALLLGGALYICYLSLAYVSEFKGFQPTEFQWVNGTLLEFSHQTGHRNSQYKTNYKLALSPYANCLVISQENHDAYFVANKLSIEDQLKLGDSIQVQLYKKDCTELKAQVSAISSCIEVYGLKKGNTLLFDCKSLEEEYQSWAGIRSTMLWVVISVLGLVELFLLIAIVSRHFLKKE